MTRALRLSLPLALPLALSLAALAASADEAATLGIYQQRLADGRIVITDRPVEGAKTVRTWQMAREDAAAARQRSEQVRLEAQVVSERVQRRIDHQQALADDLEVQRLRLGLAEAQRDAEMARASAADTTFGYLGPGFYPRHGQLLPPSLGPRPKRPEPHKRPVMRRHDMDGF